MATTQTRSSPTSGLPYYVWEAPGKPVSIQLSFDVIDRMQPDILRGLGALKRRGAEVGGILLGRLDPEWPDKVVIEDFETVPTEYLHGPSYHLSTNDLASFSVAVERHSHGGEGSLKPVGFYRSHTRDELFMDDDDLALAQRFFPGEGNVFLLIKPFASRPCLGGFFFWEDGAINRESSYLQFPFNRGELGGGESRPTPAAPRPEAERPLPPYTPVSELPPRPTANSDPPPFTPEVRSNLSILSAPPEKPRRSAMSLALWLLIAFVVAAGAAGVFAYRELAAPKQSVAAPAIETGLPLKLSVAEKQNQLDVTWDRNAPVIMRATGGLLAITDGANRRDLALTTAQLQTGRVLYSRLSGDVGLRLEVYGAGPVPVTESIRIVSTEQPRTAAGEQPQEKKAAEVAAERPKPAVERKADLTPAARPKAARREAPKPDPVTEAVSAPPAPPAPKTEAPPAEVELQRPARRR